MRTRWVLLILGSLAIGVSALADMPPSRFDKPGPAFLIDLGIFLATFLATIALELPIYYLLCRRLAPARRIFAVAATLNLATHPLFYLSTAFLQRKHPEYYGWGTLTAWEAVVVAAEAWMLSRMLGTSALRSILTSASANLGSLLIGLAFILSFIFRN